MLTQSARTDPHEICCVRRIPAGVRGPTDLCARIFRDKIFLTGRAVVFEGRAVPVGRYLGAHPSFSFPTDIAILISSSSRSHDTLPDTRTSGEIQLLL